MDRGRLYYLDVMRVVAILAVIMVHVSAQNLYDAKICSNEWIIFNAYDSLVRWCVPLFVMISGSLFLNRNIEIYKIYRKYLLRLVIAFIFWSIIYALYAYFKDGLSLTNFVLEIISGHYHMWYIFMICGLYILTPILKKIAESESVTKYYILLAIIFTFIINMIINQVIPITRFSNMKIISIFIKHYNDMHLDFLFGFTCYYLLGYYLSKKDISSKNRILIYIISIICFIGTILLTIIASSRLDYLYLGFYNYLNINTLLESVGVFIFIKYLFQNKKQNRFITYMAKHSFGIYLVHILVIEILNDIFEINTLIIHPIIAVPFLVLTVFIISLFISIVIGKIPILKKYVV